MFQVLQEEGLWSILNWCFNAGLKRWICFHPSICRCLVFPALLVRCWPSYKLMKPLQKSVWRCGKQGCTTGCILETWAWTCQGPKPSMPQPLGNWRIVFFFFTIVKIFFLFYFLFYWDSKLYLNKILNWIFKIVLELLNRYIFIFYTYIFISKLVYKFLFSYLILVLG